MARSLDTGQDGDQKQGDDDPTEAGQKDCATTEAGEEKPGKTGANEGDACAAEGDALRGGGIYSCLLQKSLVFLSSS